MDVSRLNSLAISEKGFIFDPSTGNSYNTNETGIKIIQLLKQEKSVEDIAHVLSQEYNVKNDIAKKDVLMLMELIRSYYLI